MGYSFVVRAFYFVSCPRNEMSPKCGAGFLFRILSPKPLSPKPETDLLRPGMGADLRSGGLDGLHADSDSGGLLDGVPQPAGARGGDRGGG